MLAVFTPLPNPCHRMLPTPGRILLFTQLCVLACVLFVGIVLVQVCILAGFLSVLGALLGEVLMLEQFVY